MAVRTCELCSMTYEQHAGRASRWCRPCRPEAARQNAKRWYYSNPDKRANHTARDPEYVRAYRASRPRCDVQGCGKPKIYKDGLCNTHHSRVVRTGTSRAPGPRPFREALIDPNGYRRIRVAPGAYKLEHRMVMEASLGRDLEPFENVHHKNGIRTDNRLLNLEVWVTAQPSGQRPEDLAAWVVAHYPDLVRTALEDRQQEAEK